MSDAFLLFLDYFLRRSTVSRCRGHRGRLLPSRRGVWLRQPWIGVILQVGPNHSVIVHQSHWLLVRNVRCGHTWAIGSSLRALHSHIKVTLWLIITDIIITNLLLLPLLLMNAGSARGTGNGSQNFLIRTGDLSLFKELLCVRFLARSWGRRFRSSGKWGQVSSTVKGCLADSLRGTSSGSYLITWYVLLSLLHILGLFHLLVKCHLGWLDQLLRLKLVRNFLCRGYLLERQIAAAG